MSTAVALTLTGLIGGKKVSADSNFDVTNPATQASIGEVSDLRTEHAQAAIDAASKAFESWRATTPETRIEVLNAWADAIESRAEKLASTVCAESGKPMREARGEIGQCAALLRWFAECIPNLKAETISETGLQKNETIKQPVGVVAIITPWNFPAAAVIVKAGAAIAAGCTTIIKPSEETPLIALALASLGYQGRTTPRRHQCRALQGPKGSRRNALSEPGGSHVVIYRLNRHWSRVVCRMCQHGEARHTGARWQRTVCRFRRR